MPLTVVRRGQRQQRERRRRLGVADLGRERELRRVSPPDSEDLLFCDVEALPDSTGECNFATSGDCLVIEGRNAWFGSGGERSRVFHPTDRVLTWRATDSTIPGGWTAAGVCRVVTGFTGVDGAANVCGSPQPATSEAAPVPERLTA